MPDQNPKKDELADALARLADGEHPTEPTEEEEADHRSGLDEVLMDEVRPAARPAAPPAVLSAAPAAPEPPGGRPQRAAAPGLPAQPPEQGFGEPTAPDQPPQPEPAPEQAMQIIDDDDSVIVPAPSPDVFLHKAPAPRPAHGPVLQSLQLRRTLIPILLTNGVMLPVLGAAWFALGEDSRFRVVGPAVPITLIVVGVVLLGLGLLNVLQVRSQVR